MVRFPQFGGVGALAMSALCAMAIGCGGGGPVLSDTAKEREQLRKVVLAYTQATSKLKRPPKDAKELRPFLEKVGDPDQLLRSPRNGEEFVIHWGTNLSSLPQVGLRWPIWLYEKTPHRGTRWVVQERKPFELTEDEFRQAAFAPGFKTPS